MDRANLLQPYLFHERQDGALCAQHCLNNLLQAPLFSAGDLSEIAQRLDGLEDEARERREREPSPESLLREVRAGGGVSRLTGGSDYSFNASRTGLFSLGVIEEALKVFKLSLVRWHSQEARAAGLADPGTAMYQEALVSQRAYILNLREHWYTLRRFGLASDPQGIWFDLNSMLPKPTYVGDNYLGLLLAEGQAKDYNIFIVVPDGAEASWPETEADEAATGILHETLSLDDDLSKAIEASLTEAKVSKNADPGSTSRAPPTAVSADEMRRARLARFG